MRITGLFRSEFADSSPVGLSLTGPDGREAVITAEETEVSRTPEDGWKAFVMRGLSVSYAAVDAKGRLKGWTDESEDNAEIASVLKTFELTEVIADGAEEEYDVPAGFVKDLKAE